MSRSSIHTYRHLPSHEKSFALLSSEESADVVRAVVFIHGFNGSASKTWTDFLSLVDDDVPNTGWWKPSDLFFFDYQWASVDHQLVNNTIEVFKFARAVFPQPEKVLGPDNGFRPESFRYKELVLVGHSEGGLLIRRAIIEAAQDDEEITALIAADRGVTSDLPPPRGLLTASVRLFAPALGGAKITGLLGVLTSLGPIAAALAGSASKSGMEPTSPAVTQPRTQTDRYAERLPYACFRAHILWAHTDRIIIGEKYTLDKHCRTFPDGTDHVSVCKPTINYLLPLSFVERGANHDGCK